MVLDNRYRILGLLGRGGMGEVYRADDLRLGQQVALKFLPANLSRDPVRLAQFHNEVRTARQVSHPNVCRVYDIGEFDGQLFITMEYVDGEDLSILLRRIGRLPEDKGLEIARQICAGLAAAHERGVLHRDLKPANIMLDGAGKVRIMDFSLAAVGEVKDVRAGTPAYMAPEQLSGQEVTVRSDIYALGLVLYEIFTGRRAFEAKTLTELVEQHQSGTLTAPTTIVKALDPAIEAAILRCLDQRSGAPAGVGDPRVGGAARRRSAGGGARGRRNAVAGNGRGRRRRQRDDDAGGRAGVAGGGGRAGPAPRRASLGRHRMRVARAADEAGRRARRSRRGAAAVARLRRARRRTTRPGSPTTTRTCGGRRNSDSGASRWAALPVGPPGGAALLVSHQPAAAAAVEQGRPGQPRRSAAAVATA